MEHWNGQNQVSKQCLPLKSLDQLYVSDFLLIPGDTPCSSRGSNRPVSNGGTVDPSVIGGTVAIITGGSCNSHP